MSLPPAGPEFPRPLVVTIGAMKAGTSSLHRWMDKHPELSMSLRKELNYFTRPRPPIGGLRAYRAMFPKPGRIAGESSVNYTKYTLFPGVPERMHAAVPDARMIYVLREPIARAVSHYQHNLSHGRERRDIREAFRELDGNHYVATSCYHDQVSRFLRHFDRSQFLFVDFADLRDAPNDVMARIFEFLGVDPSFRHPEFGRVHHDSAAKGRPNRLGAPISTIPVLRHVRYALPSVFEAPLEKPVLPDELRERIASHIRSDVEAIRALSGLPLPSWSL